MSDEQRRELEELLLEMETGQLQGKRAERLKSILKNSPAAREDFIQWQLMNAALKLEAEIHPQVDTPALAANQVPAAPTLPRRKDPRIEGIGPVWGTVATLVFLVAAASLFAIQFSGKKETSQLVEKEASSPNPPVSPGRPEKTSEGVALVTRMVDVLWSDPASPLEIGDAIKPGTLAMDQGLVQIEFFCGATLVVEGPAELEIETASLARVRRGRLRATVPPVARGFTLDVDGIRVVDLGTEFGLAVEPGKTDVQVFDGEVEIPSGRQPVRKLPAGQAISRTERGIESAEYSPDRFVTMSELEAKRADQISTRMRNWREWANQIREDPRVLAFYSFDQAGPWGRTLRNSATRPLFDPSGAIVGARRVSGRWTGKGGLEFKHPGDRVRLNIPGEFQSLTFAAWVRIDSLDRLYNSLFLTDHYDQGEPHWQILDSGRLFFSVRWRSDDWKRGQTGQGRAHHPVVSPPFWKPSMSGKWLQIVTTFDAGSGTVTHYLNGRPIHSEKIPEQLMVTTTRIGEATIGNWSIPTRPDEKFAIRNLNGTIDELLILTQAISADEVALMYRKGKP